MKTKVDGLVINKYVMRFNEKINRGVGLVINVSILTSFFFFFYSSFQFVY